MKRDLIREIVDRPASEATISGWIKKIRNHGNLKFIDLEDRSGSLQCVVKDDVSSESEQEVLRIGSVVKVTGVLVNREDDQINQNELYGNRELRVEEISILNVNSHSIFELNRLANEETRLKQRYLDLRSHKIIKALKIKSRIKQQISNFFLDRDFIEVEMPTLSIPTPEGARDFLVKSSLQEDHYFSLLQSPQLYKQMLMLTPIERYFSFPKCYRDEELRADRQPEFTQLDVELSYVDSVEELIELARSFIENLMGSLFQKRKYSFSTLTYEESMTKYGSDKPNFDIYDEICPLTEAFANSDCMIFRGKEVAALAVEIDETKNHKKISDLIEKAIRDKFNLNMATFTRSGDGTLSGKLAKRLNTEEQEHIDRVMLDGSIVLINSKDSSISKAKRELLTAYEFISGEISGVKKVKVSDTLRFCFIRDIPMFERGDDGKLKTKHHPFTKPIAVGEMEKWNSRAFDLVCCGHELLSGSLRIENVDMQRDMFRACGISDSDIERRYGFFLRALEHGAPPHGGFALGFDRLVATLLSLDSIRETLAFPKNTAGKDLLFGAPVHKDFLKNWETI